MKASLLNKLTPAARKEVIRMEAELRLLDETLAYIDKVEEALDGKNWRGLL